MAFGKVRVWCASAALAVWFGQCLAQGTALRLTEKEAVERAKLPCFLRP